MTQSFPIMEPRYLFTAERITPMEVKEFGDISPEKSHDSGEDQTNNLAAASQPGYKGWHNIRSFLALTPLQQCFNTSF